jgi:hypothetical protein
MKRFGVILLLVCAMAVTVSASVEVYNYSFKTSYFPFEPISGEINISIVGEDFDSLLTSGDGDSIVLGDFLTDNGVIYYCSPPDCSNDYSIISGSADETLAVGTDKTYLGFVLTGENIAITGLNFNIRSDFNSSIYRPLTIDFFEGGEWKFNEFSDTFSQQHWGCYDESANATGPLIGTSSYCEMIEISETGSVYVGADVDLADDKNLTMILYPENGGSYLGQCEFNPNDYPGCKIDADLGEVFEESKYKVCVKADEATDYTIYEESVGPMCGFVYSNGPDNSVKDYSIFARTAQYAGSGFFSPDDLDFSALVSAADDLLVERYGRDCSNTCILPMEFTGIPQSVRVSSVDLDYTVSGEFYQSNEVSSLESIPASVDFDGILDLSLTGFNISGAGNYGLFLGGEKLFEEEVEQIPAPIITSLSPNNPPAGVPVTFYVGVNFDNPNATLTYIWDFGNGSVKTTVNNSVVHTFPLIKNYSIIVEVSAGGNLTSKKGFVVEAISPREAVNATLMNLRKSLDGVKSKLASFPAWYNSELEELINYTFFDGEFTRLERDYNVSSDDSDLLEIAEKLYSLNIPTNVFIKEETGFETLTQSEDIDPQIILDFAGGSAYEDLNEYIDPILRWQTQTVRSEVSTKKISVAWLDGSSDAIFRTYRYNVTSYSDDESYLIIKRPLFKLFFEKDNDPSARKVDDDNTVVVFDAGENKIFEFYYKSPDETPFFMAPKLGKLVVEANIDETCNFNLICEKEFGENYKTCPSDCKQSTSKVILYIILAVVFGFILYILLQVWYKKNYENHLFGDQRQLYNLLMYIANARARGKADNEIRKDLSKQGWSSERLTYVFKKSRGERTGMVEIIPFDKIAAYARNRKARANIATGSKQQMGRNINKSGFQRRPIRR